MLDRLPRLPAGREGAARAAALAALAALLQVQQGPPRAREDAAGGLGAAAAKLGLPVRAPSTRSQPWPSRAPAPTRRKPLLPVAWRPRAQPQAALRRGAQGAPRRRARFMGPRPPPRAGARAAAAPGPLLHAARGGRRRLGVVALARAGARLILVPQLSPYSSTTHASGSPCSKHAQARLTAPRGMPLMRFSEHARGAAAPREPAAAGRWPAPAGRAGREPARAAALTAAPPRSRAQAQALLLHVLIVALVAEGGELGAAQFERLRAALRAAPADLAGLYRCAPPGAGRGRAGAWAGQRLVGGGLWPARPRVATLHGPDAPFCSAALLPANRAWAICPRAWLATRPIKLSAAQASCVGEAGAAAPARN